MKIARNIAAFGRHVEWYSPHPGSLSEGAGSPIGLTEGVSFDGCSMPTIFPTAPLALKFLSGYVHRSTLPQLRIRSAAPSEREPGTVAEAFAIQPGTCETMGLRAIFIAPTKTQKSFPFTTHRGTLPQSRPLGVTAPSEREPGTVAGADTIQPGTCETVGLRAIFIAPTELRMFNRPHSLEGTKILSFFLRLLCNPADCGKMGQNIPGCPGGGAGSFCQTLGNKEALL